MADHPSEQPVGRIRNDGGWDRRFRQAEPDREADAPGLLDILRPLAVVILWVAALWMLSAIVSALQVQP